MKRGIVLMNWKTQHSKNVNFLQIDLYINVIFIKMQARKFCSQWQAYGKNLYGKK